MMPFMLGAWFIFLSWEVVWAEFMIPWDRLSESIERHGMVDRLACERGVCVLSWTRDHALGWEQEEEHCLFKPRIKRVECRYPYDT